MPEYSIVQQARARRTRTPACALQQHTHGGISAVDHKLPLPLMLARTTHAHVAQAVGAGRVLLHDSGPTPRSYFREQGRGLDGAPGSKRGPAHERLDDADRPSLPRKVDRRGRGSVAGHGKPGTLARYLQEKQDHRAGTPEH
jgi:hypothetical protein